MSGLRVVRLAISAQSKSLRILLRPSHPILRSSECRVRRLPRVDFVPSVLQSLAA